MTTGDGGKCTRCGQGQRQGDTYGCEYVVFRWRAGGETGFSYSFNSARVEEDDGHRTSNEITDRGLCYSCAREVTGERHATLPPQEPRKPDVGSANTYDATAGQAYERGRLAGLAEAAAVVRAEVARLREPHNGAQAAHVARMIGANALQRAAGLIDRAATLVSATRGDVR